MKVQRSSSWRLLRLPLVASSVLRCLAHCFAACIFAAAAFAKAEKTPLHVEFEAETYSERGEMTGCGLSFVTLWQDDSKILGATGSLNFFFLSRNMNVAAGFKLTGVINGQPVPVLFAWADVDGYGKTTDFMPAAPEVPGSFISWKSSDPKSSLLPSRSSQSGFVLGVSFQGLPLDELVELPPAPVAVSEKIGTCMEELQKHMAGVVKGG